jgi:hypothetical protein
LQPYSDPGKEMIHRWCMIADGGQDCGTRIAGRNGLQDAEGFVDNGVGGMGSGRKCMLEVGDVVISCEGTETGLIWRIGPTGKFMK